MRTTHPSRLSLHFSPPLARLPLLFPSVCCLKPSNEIHTNQDGRLDAVLSAFSLPVFRLIFVCFSFIFSLPPSLLSFPSVLHTFLHPCLCPFISLCGPPFLPGPILPLLPLDFYCFVCVYPPFLFPRHPSTTTFSVFLHFHSCRPPLEARWLYFHLFI